jgi:predicted PurR-regulated permease PerM
MFDGYILGPRILGGSTGVSSFWILFSILLFGGLFGFVGMLIAVPTFAVIYKLFAELVVWHLNVRHLSGDITDYEELDHIDPGNKTYIKNDRGSDE